jgi:hypothetical protein
MISAPTVPHFSHNRRASAYSNTKLQPCNPASRKKVARAGKVPATT